MLALLQQQIRLTHTRSRLRKSNRTQRLPSELVPNIYKFQNTVDHKMFYDLKVNTNRINRSATREARWYRGKFNDANKSAMSGDMGMYKDNLREASRTDWF